MDTGISSGFLENNSGVEIGKQMWTMFQVSPRISPIRSERAKARLIAISSLLSAVLLSLLTFDGRSKMKGRRTTDDKNIRPQNADERKGNVHSIQMY